MGKTAMAGKDEYLVVNALSFDEIPRRKSTNDATACDVPQNAIGTPGEPDLRADRFKPGYRLGVSMKTEARAQYPCFGDGARAR
jgi:hypothetical protein